MFRDFIYNKLPCVPSENYDSSLSKGFQQDYPIPLHEYLDQPLLDQPQFYEQLSSRRPVQSITELWHLKVHQSYLEDLPGYGKPSHLKRHLVSPGFHRPLWTEDYQYRGYLISNIRRRLTFRSVINRSDNNAPAFSDWFLDAELFERSFIQFSPDGRFLLISASEMDPFLDLILMDFHGQFVHSWRHTIADGALPKDLCWLDEEHFLVRMGNDAHEPETVDGLLNAHEITHDSVRIFDIRSLPQPVEQKVLPYRIKHFDTAKNDAGRSWLIGTGLVYNQIPFDPLSPVLFNEGLSLMQMAYVEGHFGPHQIFPEFAPIVPVFPVDDDLQVFWNLSTTTHIVPSNDGMTGPSMLLLKNLWEPEIGLPGWPCVKLLEPRANGGPIFGDKVADVKFSEQIPGMYALVDVASDPLGGGFLGTVISLTPMPDPPKPDRDVAVYHHVYFSLLKSEEGNGYEVMQRAVISEHEGPGRYKCPTSFAPNGLYAIRSRGNELEFVTNGEDVRPFGDTPTDQMVNLKIRNRIIFGKVGLEDGEGQAVLAAAVNPSDYLNIAVLTYDGHVHLLNPQF